MTATGRRSKNSAVVRVLTAEWPLLTVLAVCAAGVLVVLSEHFRRGTVLFAGALVLAACLRALLPGDSAGLLIVRGRVIDVITLAGLGFAIVVAALYVPAPPA